MSGLEITEVDPFDAGAYEAWHAAYLAAELADRGPDAEPWSLEESRAALQQRSASARRHAYAGTVAGEVVAAGFLGLPLSANRHRAELAVHVRPEARRRGHGTALLTLLEGHARRHGRTVAAAEVGWRYELGADGTGDPGREFALGRGYELALSEVMRRLDLPVAEELLDRLAAEAAAHHPGYTLRSWVGPVPEDVVAGWAALDSTLVTEAPTGDLVVEPGAGDVAEVREREELARRQGRTSYGTVALDPAGQVCAYTEVVHSSADGRAHQWGTLVRRADRGHRLGVAVKVANLRLLQRDRPQVRILTTYNAESNAHMIGVNEALGFRPVGRLGSLQKRLG